MENWTLKRTSWLFAAGIVLLVSTIILIPISSRAQTTRYWIGGTSDLWGDDGNWNPSGVPQPGDTAIIDTGASVTYNDTSTYSSSNPLGQLQIDYSSTLIQNNLYPGSYLGVTNTQIGIYDYGYYQQSAGTHEVVSQAYITNPYTGSGVLTLGLESGSTGTYELSGTGTLNVGLWEYVGFNGQGYFNQSGGLHTIRDDLYLGYNPGAYGEYNLIDGTLEVGWEYIGRGGTGVFNQTGGINRAFNELNIDGGTYNLENGILETGKIYLGYGGTGTFNHSGGSHTVSGDLILGVDPGSNGTYNLSQIDPSIDSVLTVNGATIVGNSGTGVFNQSGGTHTITGGYPAPNFSGDLIGLDVGSKPGSSGTYNLTGGFLYVSNFTVVGNEGNGVFNLGDPFSGGDGTHNTAGLFVGFNGGNGQYNLYSGTLNAGGITVIGGKDYNSAPGFGEFNQYGGTNTTGGLWLGDSVGSNGTYNLIDGELITSFEVVGMRGTGIFNQTGGTHTVNGNLNITEWGSSGNGTYNLVDGDLYTNNTIVGYFGTGAFNQSGGTHTITNDLNLAQWTGSGTYDLNGGTLSVGGAERVGFFGTGTFTQWSGTTHTVSVALTVGNDPGSNGTYTMNGGVLTIGHFDALGNPLQDASALIGNGGTGSFTQNNGTVKISADLNLGQNAGVTGSYDLINGSLFVGRYEHVGVSGNGTFTQNGGTHTVANDLVLANDPGSTGTFYLNGGDLTVQWNETIGMNGSGYFSQVDGTTHTVIASSPQYGALVLGANSGAYGNYDMSGGTLNTNFLQIGGSGTGDFVHTGGTVNVNQYIPYDPGTPGGGVNLGQVFGSIGTYDISGTGVLNAHDIGVGLSGTGSFTQWAGTQVNVTSGVVLGYDVSGTGVGTYNLYGGQLVSSYMQVGGYGTGTFNHEGGSNSTGTLTIGVANIGTGTYNLGGSSSILSVTDNSVVGQDGTGFFNQSDGTHTVGQILFIGQNATGVGTYNMSGGVLNADRLGVGRYGSGTFNQSGGTVNVSTEFAVTTRSSGSGLYNLSGTDSLLNAYLENVGKYGNGTFNQTGGTNNVTTDLILGSQDATYGTGTGTYNLDGGQLTVGNNVIIGNGGSGTFNQSGGTTNKVTGNVEIGTTSSYNMTGGTLNAASIINNGGFINAGATVNALVTNYGKISGSGTFNGNISNYGIVSPGSSPGKLTIIGNYTQGPLGTLEIDLGGLVPGAGYDVLDITGAATLGGKLDVDLYGGFIPHTGDDFTFLVASSGVSLTFGSYDLPYGSSYWNIIYGTNSVTLEYLGGEPVPEPSTAFLLLSGILGLGALGRRLRG